MQKDDNTELKIKETAKRLFQEKGFDAVRTREIAEEAGINSALLHYYFRSKEKLFHLIMIESISEMFSFMRQIINASDTSLGEKIDLIVDGYTNVIRNNPRLALFVLNELNTNSEKIIMESDIPKDMLTNSLLFRQINEQLEKKSIHMSPLHIMLNTITLSVIPFIARPLIEYLHGMQKENANDFIEERRRLIPMWIKGMLQLDE